MENESQHASATPRDFTFQLLKQITNDFSEDNRIGVGGYGVVYKGTLDNGEVIAVKKLYYKHPGLDSDKQFQNECTNLMRVHHQNIVRLVGYCHEIRHICIEHNGRYVFAMVEDRALCFEYLEGGSLDKHLSDESCGFGWHTRYKIIKGICEGLNYLHNGSKESIFHLDLKPANILLDRNMMPKIGDFGLSRLFDSTETCSTKGIIGTPGYMPPEYINRFHITPKFDVFSLGVTIIKIIAGHQGYSKFADMSSQEFIQLVHENWEKALRTTVLSDTSHGVKKCIEIALKCVEADRAKRPTIAEVVDELSKIDTTIIDELNKIDTARSSPIEQVTNLRSNQAFNPCVNSGMFAKDGSMISSCNSRATRASSDSVLLSTNIKCQILPSASLKIFSYDDLRLATRRFRANAMTGEGGFGCVCKGWIDENTFSPCKPGTGIPVAVKIFNPESLQEHQEWLAEINHLGHLSHPNLVKLFGYCLEDEYLLLVYEFLPHGSLENHLFRRGSCQPLSWNLRMKVALGAAKALAYLHSTNIIVRDVKNSNILLDTDYNVKLTGFGLAVNGPVGEECHLSTRIMGTYGYAAPEYVATGHLTQKCDIYGFGVLLLEMLSGRRALDPDRPAEEPHLVDWARPYLKHKHKIRCVIDAKLGGIYSFGAVQKIAALALECVCSDPKKRPAMDSVVSVLEGVQEDEEPEAAEHQESGKKVTASASRKNGKSRWNIFGGGRS
ncbi:receptor-like cytoplasmic kinase 176 isoform X1 [Triticum dicoccoides]|uniref:receptor-like cytoplasmic kinase 176 isoform X1 n=2 Tax=Triticum dicoccoides TaxID=85692 RepID=UPI001890F936|nr:receptor-like cytoplasmic kinase 176 isoform X1 [Triticum dicoccoides]XP_037441874.1 receptor-like cytoplasmic kinase 176 isoform X1 [Triticum dicoccoides]